MEEGALFPQLPGLPRAGLVWAHATFGALWVGEESSSEWEMGDGAVASPSPGPRASETGRSRPPAYSTEAQLRSARSLLGHGTAVLEGWGEGRGEGQAHQSSLSSLWGSDALCSGSWA